MKKYKVGIIGCGFIFDRHIEAIQANREDYQLVAICDVDKKKADIRAKEYDVKGFYDYKEMLKIMKADMNFVVIATPNSYHYEQAINSLKSGNDILVEKPVDFIHSRIQKIIDTAKKYNKNAYGVLQVRYNPTVQMLKEGMKKDIIGELRSISLIQRWQRPSTYFDSWRADEKIGGRILYEVGIHYLDIMQYIFGLPKAISTVTFNNKHKHVKFEDTIFSILKFSNGASGSIEVTIAAEPSNLECSISVMGSEGYIKIGGRALDKVEIAKFSNSLVESAWIKLQSSYGDSIPPNSYGTHLGSCPNHPYLYEEIAKGKGILLKDTLNSVKLIENIYKVEITK